MQATKDWNLNNTDNENLLLFESTGSDDGLPIALEFLDYYLTGSFDNSNCDITLEQQTDDLATTQTGLNVLGIVNTDTEPLNDDGTYKRSIYHQVKTMFYNNYLDQSKIWGIENIDFTLSQTIRDLSDQFRLISIPRTVYGDKITPKTVVVYDNTLDNVYAITDDGNGNLFAGINLFSHQQEVGEYKNGFIAGKSSSYCDSYWPPSNITTVSFPPDIPLLTIGFSFGSTETFPLSEPVTMPVSLYSGSLTDTVIYVTVTGSFPPDNPTLTASFVSGSLFTTVMLISASVDNASITTSFVSGSLFTTVILVTSSFDSASVYCIVCVWKCRYDHI